MAMVDIMAQMLSERTGTKFEVLRGRLPGSHRGMLYGLKATRGGATHRFQAHRPMKLADLTRWLASINDMVNMGFIPVDARAREDELT